ncbi:Glycosyltransferase-like [hydrothermal vent metagenome]|uniref:Glycosyltransferase-like n=1 Tax=hydrothermal vent metagenome TaxID=652676 RepID=A0A3B0WMJ0_9ZZZZ
MTIRIAHFIDTQNKGGAEVTLMDLAIYQKNAGHDVFIYHHNNAYINELCNLHKIKSLPIPSHKHYKHTYTLPLYSIAFARSLNKYNIEVLHSHLFGPITGNALAAKLSGTRHIGTLHDIYMIEEKPSRIKLLLLSYKLGTQLVCVSKDMAIFYQQRLAINANKITTIYNAAMARNAPDEETKQAIYKRYAINKNNIIIATVGRLVPLKRIDWIIDALGAIDKQLLDQVSLLIIGDGPENKSLLKLAEGALSGNIIFTGEIENVSDLLNMSDIYVQFSNTEGLSRSIIEALACRLPCVVSDVGGNRELVLHNKNGFTIPASNRKQLSKNLSSLIRDKDLRKNFGSESLHHFKKNFNFDDFQINYLNIYKK